MIINYFWFPILLLIIPGLLILINKLMFPYESSRIRFFVALRDNDLILFPTVPFWDYLSVACLDEWSHQLVLSAVFLLSISDVFNCSQEMYHCSPR